MRFNRDEWMKENDVRAIEIRSGEHSVQWIARGRDGMTAIYGMSHYEHENYNGNPTALVFFMLAEGLANEREKVSRA